MYKSGTSSGIFRNTVRVRTLPSPCGLNSAIHIALSSDRTELTDRHRATAPMEHEEQQMRSRAQEWAVLGLQLPLFLGLAGVRRAAPKSCGDLGKWHYNPCSTVQKNPAVPRVLQFQYEVYVFLFSERQDEDSRLDESCTPGWLCLVQGRRIFISLHFFHTKVN